MLGQRVAESSFILSKVRNVAISVANGKTTMTRDGVRSSMNFMVVASTFRDVARSPTLFSTWTSSRIADMVNAMRHVPTRTRRQM